MAIFSPTEADAIRQANKIIEDGVEKSDYYMEKLLKGDIIADEKYERNREEVNKAKEFMDKMTNVYSKRMKRNG